ncbi:MAG: tetratricopeptide repeat protein [Proteobacteria bacterium]|nr:tetratricopeptide repeat protein [Pseudomonadota bacterium]MBU1709654.1 tetratricopeptide repeat protein [Pseudomonadota bacterium]
MRQTHSLQLDNEVAVFPAPLSVVGKCDLSRFVRFAGLFAGILALLVFLLQPVYAQSLTKPQEAYLGKMLSPLLEEVIPAREIVLQGSAAPVWLRKLKEARAEIRKGDFSKAVELYREVLELKRDNEIVQWELVQAFLKTGNIAAAETVIEELVEQTEEDLVYVKKLARIKLENKHSGRAIDLYQKILVKEPENRQALAGLTYCLLELGRKSEALDGFEVMRKSRPEDQALKGIIADLAYDLGDFEKTRVYVGGLAAADQADSEVLITAARVHDALGLENLAIGFWKRLADRDTGNKEAHARLAAFYKKEGRKQEALEQSLVLLDQSPDDPAILYQVANLYLETNQPARALPHLIRYVQKKPHDKKALRSLIALHAAQGNKEETFAALESYFAVEPPKKEVDLKEAARLYEATGRFKEALPLYRQLFAITPGDPEILTALAKDLLAIGVNEGALSIWRYPSRITTRGAAVFRSMANLLDRLGREDDLIEVLEVIHQLEPEDQEITLKLAILYFEKQSYIKSGEHFDILAQAGHKGQKFLLFRGLLYERTGQQGKALNDFEALLVSGKEWQKEFGWSEKDIRKRCIILAGQLGKLHSVHNHLKELDYENRQIWGAEEHLIFAQALAHSGDENQALALYRWIVDQEPESGSDGHQIPALLEMSELFRGTGRYFEAEQFLRRALTIDHLSCDVLSALFDLSLERHVQEIDPEIWLSSISANDRCNISQDLLEARMMSARGGHWGAIGLTRKLLAQQKKMKEKEDGAVGEQSAELEFALGRFLVLASEFEQAEEYFRNLLNTSFDLEARLYLQEIYEVTGNDPGFLEITKTLSAADKDLSVLLSMAEIYKRQRRFPELLQIAKVARRRAPDSVTAGILQVEALEKLGDIAGALDLIKQIITEMPDSTSAEHKLPGMLFRAGMYDEAVKQSDILLKTRPDSPDILLVKARSLWAMNDWDNSIKAYESFLKTPVEDLLRAKAEETGVVLAPAAKKKSFWDIFDFDRTDDDDFSEIIMDVVYAAENESPGQRLVNTIAAPFYAQFSWQRLFEKELSARRVVKRREYFQAVNEYEVLMREYPGEDSILFDLAGIYAHLGRLGEEASLYEQLGMRNSNYPGLTEAKERNHFKRSPRNTVSYGLRREAGRDDYKSMEKNWGGVSLWLSPWLRQEFELSVDNINYRSMAFENKIHATRAFLSYEAGIMNGLTFSLGTGVQALGDGGSDTVLAKCALKGKIGDTLTGTMSFTRDVVEDTTASITRNVVREDSAGGISLDILPRLMAGGNYGFTDYSDGNKITGYSFWTSYIILSDPTFLKLSYSYDFKDSREGRSVGPLTEDGFAEYDHPYWTPKNYWVNLFSLYFKHKFSEDTLSRGVPRYYTVEYSLGYDSKGYGQQTFRGGFFLESTENLIFEAVGEITSSQVYRKREVIVSAVYRW